MADKAIEDMKTWDDFRQLTSVASFQGRFVAKYEKYLSWEEKQEFHSELGYLIHMIYREAQQPLVKQLTDYVMSMQNVNIIGKL